MKQDTMTATVNAAELRGEDAILAAVQKYLSEARSEKYTGNHMLCLSFNQGGITGHKYYRMTEVGKAT